MFRLVAGVGSFQRVLGTLMIVVLVCGLRSSIAFGQTCGTDYTLKEGETLAQIAARIYGNHAQWTVIFYANQDRLGTNYRRAVDDA